MMKRVAVLLVALTFVLTTRAFAEDPAPKKAKPAKQPRVTETRIHESDMERIERSISKAVTAKQGTGVWEYTARKMKPPKNEKWTTIWNDMGKEGWEAVDHFENVYIFKRPAYAYSTKKEEPVMDSKDMKKEDKAKEDAMKEEDKAKEKTAKDAEKQAKKAQKEADKAAKKAQKEADKAAKQAEKDAKKAAKEAEKAAKSAQ